MSKKGNGSNAMENLVLIILAFICVSISFIQTGRGYNELAGPIFNWAFSIVISLFILLLNFRFRDHLRKGLTIVGILAFYLIVTSFSFAGNFNAFYSQFMQKELYENELKDFRSKLEGIQQKAVTALDNSNDADEIRAKVMPLKRALEEQIKNPGNPGMGQKAQSLVAEVETILGTTITPLQGRSYEETATLMGTQIENVLNDQLNVLTADTDRLTGRINAMADSIKPLIDETLLNGGSMLRDNGKELLDESARIHNTIGELAMNTLGTDQFAYEAIQSQNSQVGKISHSFQSAMRGDNPQAAWIAGVASLAVDLLVPLYIVLTVRRKEEEEEEEYDDWDSIHPANGSYTGKKVGPRVAS